MTVTRAGLQQTTYIERCVEHLRCICEFRGDRNVFIDGKGPYCLIIDREYNKIELDDVGVNSSEIEAVWVSADCLPIKKGSVIVSGGSTFKVKESPKNQYDGWTSAQLKLTCEC